MRRAAAALLFASALAFAQAAEIDVNTASQAQLESLRGIGVALSDRLLEERSRRPYTDWADLAARVPGVGPKTAERLSAQGLRIAGRPYRPDTPR
jgi:competence protein ComEA